MIKLVQQMDETWWINSMTLGT